MGRLQGMGSVPRGFTCDVSPSPGEDPEPCDPSTHSKPGSKEDPLLVTYSTKDCSDNRYCQTRTDSAWTDGRVYGCNQRGIVESVDLPFTVLSWRPVNRLWGGKTWHLYWTVRPTLLFQEPRTIVDGSDSDDKRRFPHRLSVESLGWIPFVWGGAGSTGRDRILSVVNKRYNWGE